MLGDFFNFWVWFDFGVVVLFFVYGVCFRVYFDFGFFGLVLFVWIGFFFG